jgi:hypothetical protein
MAAGSTYTPIATQTLGSAVGTVSFNSIGNAYTDLVLITQTKQSNSSTYTVLNFNGDGGSNYSQTNLAGNGSSAYSNRNSNDSRIIANQGNYESTSDWQINRYNFQNYSNTSTYKTVLFRTDISSIDTMASVGLWRSTSAITSIVFSVANSGTFIAGSTFTLYGIAAA